MEFNSGDLLVNITNIKNFKYCLGGMWLTKCFIKIWKFQQLNQKTFKIQSKVFTHIRNPSTQFELEYFESIAQQLNNKLKRVYILDLKAS